MTRYSTIQNLLITHTILYLKNIPKNISTNTMAMLMKMDVDTKFKECMEKDQVLLCDSATE